jgi:hypothetical protein
MNRIYYNSYPILPPFAVSCIAGHLRTNTRLALADCIAMSIAEKLRTEIENRDPIPLAERHFYRYSAVLIFPFFFQILILLFIKCDTVVPSRTSVESFFYLGKGIFRGDRMTFL